MGLELHNDLVARDVAIEFDGVRALAGVDLELAPAEILGVIGPNGAGKTTLLNVLSGFERDHRGRVSLAGRDVTGWSAARRARAGLVRTFQNVRLFATASVHENVALGALATGAGARAAAAAADELLALARLEGAAARPAGVLAHGDQRRVGILRAAAGRPAFLLLDEPAAGLDEHESDELLELLASVRAQLRCGLVVVEHDMRLVMGLCERVQVLDRGATIAVGSPREVTGDATVIDAYLGTAA